jgi:hypothetical protein
VVYRFSSPNIFTLTSPDVCRHESFVVVVHVDESREVKRSGRGKKGENEKEQMALLLKGL